MRLRRNVLFLLTVGLLLATAACTNSDPTSTGNSPISIIVQTDDIGTRFERVAQLEIVQLTVRPNDPASDLALGTASIGLFSSTSDILKVNLNDQTEFEPVNINLSSGSWRLDQVRLNNILLQSQDFTPWVKCEDGPVFLSPSANTVKINSVDLGGNSEFKVNANGESQVVIVIHVGALVDAFTKSFNCVGNPPFFSTFRPADFAALAPTYIEIVSN